VRNGSISTELAPVALRSTDCHSSIFLRWFLACTYGQRWFTHAASLQSHIFQSSAAANPPTNGWSDSYRLGCWFLSAFCHQHDCLSVVSLWHTGDLLYLFYAVLLVSTSRRCGCSVL
jgi:hypothetical protein